MRIDRARLAAAMIRADLNGKQLGKKAGVSRVTVSSIRRGSSCAEATVYKLARALGVAPEELLEEGSK